MAILFISARISLLVPMILARFILLIKTARYVLELNSGYTAAHHWKLGDKLDLKGILNIMHAILYYH